MSHVTPSKASDDQRRAPQPSGLRTTRQRKAVTGVLDSVSGFHSAQELHSTLRESGENVGLATVYRTLQALAESGDVDTILREDGETVYRRCIGDAHHHHLVCRDCGRTVEVEGPQVETWADLVATENGYVNVSHTLEIFGRCSACATSHTPS